MADENEKGTTVVRERVVRRGGRGRSQAASDAVYIARLEDENRGYRRSLTEAREKVRTLEAKVPEGSIVLTAEQGKIWKLLGDHKIDTPEKLEAALTETTKLKEQLASKDLDASVASAAAEAGLPVGTLKDLVKARGLKPEQRDVSVEVEEGGKKVRKTERRWCLGTGKEGEQSIEVAEYIEQHAPDYKGLLGTVSDEETVAKGTSTSTTATGTRRTVQPQGSSGSGSRSASKGGGATSAVDRVLARNRERAQAPSPLRPERTARQDNGKKE